MASAMDVDGSAAAAAGAGAGPSSAAGPSGKAGYMLPWVSRAAVCNLIPRQAAAVLNWLRQLRGNAVDG